MTAATRKSLVARRKKTPSLKARDNAAKISKPRPKLTGAKKFIHPNDFDKEPTPDSSNEVMEIPEPLKDMSNVEYTISWSVSLAGTVVEGDVELCKLGTFDYREFNVKSIKTMAKAVAMVKYDFEYKSGTAVLNARGITKAQELVFKVDDEEGWKKVETFVERFMRNGKKDIQVRLQMKYAKVSPDSPSESEDEKPGKKKKDRVHIHVLMKVDIRIQQQRK